MAAYYDVTRSPSFSNQLLAGLVGPTVYRSGYTVYYVLAGRPGSQGSLNDGGTAWRSGGAREAFGSAVAAWNAVSNLVIKPWPFYYAEGDSRSSLFTWVEKIVHEDSNSGELGRHDPPQVVEQEGAFNAQSVLWSRENNAVGGLNFVTFLHEIGHGLGLDHPHDGDLLPGVTSHDDKGAFGLNQGLFTVMSYNDGYDGVGYSPSYGYGWMATPGALDIAAVQAVYGANMTTRTGDDVYRLPSTNMVGTYFACIWDAGGVDTISGEHLTVSCTIDLRPATLKLEEGGGGFLSRAPGVFGGFTIAAGVTIEAATGGSGADRLIGNDAANILDGKAGADSLMGGGGDDRLTGGAGDDALDGGAGFDIASYADTAAGVTVRLGIGTAQATGGAGTDTLIGMEGLIGSAFADMLDGDSGNNVLNGGAGRDVLSGGVGLDVLEGGAGPDVFRGTRAELAGDVILDFERGESIRITDADLATFSFTRSGDVIDLGRGQRLTVRGLSGQLRVQAAPGGGVELVAPDAVRGDINGDGRADVLWRHEGGALTNWLGTADGGFAGNDAAAFHDLPTGIKVAGTGDFDGDGRADVLWRGDNGALTNWLGRADGGFVGNDAAALHNVSTSWKVAGVGDFNGDGRADVLWRHDNGAMTNWLGRADGGFTGNDAAASFAGIPTSLKVAAVADFNGDGHDDILWRGDNGAFTNWLGRADGGFVGNDAVAFHNVPTSWKVAGAGDFNGDGFDDVLWRNDNGTMTDWLGRADGGFVGNDAAATFSGIPASLRVADVADFNGDGRDDILWRHDNGAMTNWLGRADGGFVGNDAVAYFQVPPSWQTQPQEIMLA